MMKVLFVYTREFPQSPVKPLVDFEAIQFGISHISSYLKQKGHNTRLLVMTRDSNFSQIDQFVREFDPQLICFTAVASEYAFIEKIGRYIKQHFENIFLMAGGVHVSLRPDESMLETFDACCIGEGEEATFELVTQLEQNKRPSGIANLWIKHGDQIEKNATRSFIPDLDVLPNADREIWMEWIDMERSPQRPSLLLGRGCPFLCTYCCNHSLKKLAAGRYVRFRSQENVIGEIRELLVRFPKMKEIYFEVETLGANVEWGLELCSKLTGLNATLEHPLSFGVNFRITPNMKRMEELFAALKSSNFRFVNIGLESGSERVRREVLRRNYDNDDVVSTVELAKKYGLDVIFYNLIGLPFETVEDCKETIRINRICQPAWHYLSIFYPYPGTDLYEVCHEHGFLPPDLLTTGKERVAAALDFPEFRRAQIQKAFIWFDYYVYNGYKPDDQLFNIIVDKYFQTYAELNRVRLLMIIVRDLFDPALRFYPELNEKKIIGFFIAGKKRAVLQTLKNKLHVIKNFLRSDT